MPWHLYLTAHMSFWNRFLPQGLNLLATKQNTKWRMK